MLQRLYIENYALIEQLSIDFGKGFTVITGETGAGKSIILGALSLILGQRAEVRVIKEGATKCIVEAEFKLSANSMEAFFTENDLEYSGTDCMLRRELYSNGKSRAFVNDSPVSLAILKELTLQLIDIHSQHQNLLLGKDSFQLNVLDTIAMNNQLLDGYQTAYQHYKTIQANLQQLEHQLNHAHQEEEYLRFQYDQLKSANLNDGEQEALEAESELLTHAEEIKIGLGKLYSMLDDDGTGINSRLSQALNQTDSLKRLFSKVQEYEERLRSCYIDLKDLSSEIGVLVNDVEINPARMDQVNDRLNLIYDLQQKHRVNTLAELISLRNELAGRLANIESSDEALTSLRNELKAAEKTAAEKATILSNARSKARKPLEDKLTNLLKQLGMPKAALKIEQQKKAFETDGADTIRFLFSANTNARLQPIDEIASGGEISRIMLCIKSVIADTSSLSTLVFDEIDTGVSGEIADKMGDIMQDIAESRQVICITHLPQIAAKGKDHFKVIKTDIQGHSQTVVNRLTDKDRLMEIAQMLSGANVTDAAILNARTLLIENTKQ